VSNEAAAAAAAAAAERRGGLKRFQENVAAV
jgi:hypothetical protein